MQRKLAFAVASVIICEAIGISSAIFTFASIPNWYAALIKPWFTPPPWIFGPVWTIIYALIGLSLYFLLSEKGKTNTMIPTALFSLQLALNFAWSAIFFGARSAFYGFLDIIFLWLVIIATTISFYKVSRHSALMLLPYLFWVTFAMVLNFYILKLNP